MLSSVGEADLLFYIIPLGRRNSALELPRDEMAAGVAWLILEA